MLLKYNVTEQILSLYQLRVVPISYHKAKLFRREIKLRHGLLRTATVKQYRRLNEKSPVEVVGLYPNQ